jgi:predicted amidohydrolase YtcJ
MPKEKLTLSVDKEVVEKAKNLGINISDITEKVLKGYTSVERPEGSFHEAYKQLFDSIQELLKEFDCRVKIAESWFYSDEEDQQRIPQDETYLTGSGSFFVKTYLGPEDFYIYDIKKSQEKRKEKMDEILMAKRIIDAMAETLLKKQPTKEK